jgi:transposase
MNMASTSNLQPLPDTIEALQQLLTAQQQALLQKEQRILHQDALLLQKEQRIQLLEEYVRLQKLKRFGSSAETAVDQQEMFNEAELSAAAEVMLAEEVAPADTQALPAQAKDTPKRGRKPLPASLPRLRIEHDLPETELRCACGCQRTLIGEESSEQLDIVPAQVRVLVNVRKKYACPACEGEVLTTPLPAQPIPKSNASPGLLAHVAVAKYQDALPLYRQEAMLVRAGVDIPRNTLASWMIKAGELVQPLLNLLEDQLLDYPVLHVDETTVQVLQEPGKTATSASYMWVRVGGPPTQPIRLFHYADSRKGSVASTLLAGYSGYLQTDDYGGYNAVAGSTTTIVHQGCWAHARRKFVEAQKANPGKAGKATMAINLIARLYAIEQRVRGCAIEDKYAVRQQEAVPQLQVIRDWLDKTLHSALPKGLLGKALAYLDRNWNKLTVYCEDGRLCIDNNPAENAIRPFVVGRKNWLFSATVPGAKASANLYSLIETAKSNGLEPYAYLQHVFTELPEASTVEAMETLLPWNVKLPQRKTC